MKSKHIIFSIIFLINLPIVNSAYAEVFKIGIMQDRKVIVRNYIPLKYYMKSKGIFIDLQGFMYYPDAAKSFSAGHLDAMFAGSGVAGSMIIKGLAYPLLRPVSKEGWSTYWAVILAPKGSPKFSGNRSYFKGKTIACCSLASSGEFFARSMIDIETKLKIAGSHDVAIDNLAGGKADIAIVKNRVWDSVKTKYPNLEQVGEDDGENPNESLIVSYRGKTEIAEKIKNILLGIDSDYSSEAHAVKASLKITKFIPTTKDDFSHTIELLMKAGVIENRGNGD